MPQMLSYYEILQIEENASPTEIKSAYRKMCKILHPDLHNNTREANVIFNLLHEAYETLSDPVKKRNYNPNHKKPESSDISKEKYMEIITGYKKIVRDYERIIKSKNQREKDLLEEIKNLKEGVKSESFNQVHQEDNTETIEINQEVNKDSGYNEWVIVILSLLGIGVIFLIAMIPDVWWIIIGLIVAPIWLFFSIFK